MATTGLLSLPEELIVSIVSSCTLTDVLPFALTCKTAYRCSRHRLATHQMLHTKYGIQHDRQPLTMPTLLRLAMATEGSEDWEKAWHVKALELWDGRYDWKEWKTTSFSDSTWIVRDDADDGHADNGHADDEDSDDEESDYEYAGQVQPWLTLDPAENYSHSDESFITAKEISEYERLLSNGMGGL